MKIRWKLTDENDQTSYQMQWGKNITHQRAGTGRLCTSGWIHVYSDPLLAVLLNPIHRYFPDPHLWKCHVGGHYLGDRGLKEGWSKVTTLKRVDLPDITLVQKVAFAVLCALEIYKQTDFVIWANNWLNNIDRSGVAAKATYTAAKTVANAAYVASKAAAENAATTAAYAAKAAYAAYTAAYAAKAAYAEYSAYAAGYTAINAVNTVANLNLKKLIKKAVTYV